MAYDPTPDEIAQHAEELAETRYNFLEQLVSCREARGLSQREVGNRMDVSQPAVSAIERYDANPTLSTIERYVLAVGGHLVLEVRVPHDRWSGLKTKRTTISGPTSPVPATVPAWDFPTKVDSPARVPA